MGGCTSSERETADYAEVEQLWFVKDVSASKPCDCFYVHPTTAYGITVFNVKRDSYANGKKCPDFMDPDLIENQAGAFAETCNIWAPKYSQMGMLTMCSPKYMGMEATDAHRDQWIASLNVAYADVKKAFEDFVAKRDKARPFIIAAHSQGSFCASKLVAEFIEPESSDLLDSFVAAYLAGGYLPKDMFGTIYKRTHLCTGPEDKQCIMSWDTRIKGQWEPKMLNEGMLGINIHHAYYLFFDKYCECPAAVTDEEGKDRVQVNPMTWAESNGGEYMGVKLSTTVEPLLPPDGGAAYGAEVTVNNNNVGIPDPKVWYTEYPKSGPNFHPKDIQFWFFNIKANVAARVAAFQASAVPQV